MASPLDLANAALLAAVTAGDVEAASAAVGEGADLECLEEHSHRIIPLLFKAWQGNAAVAALLLEHGRADATAINGDGMRPLHLAAEFGQSSLVSLLLEHKVNVNTESDAKWTSLHIAAEYGHISVVALLLEHRANVNAKGDDGWTPLFLAAQEGHISVVALLLERGADVNAKDNREWTPLCLAALGDHASVVALLLEHGADVNAKTNEGWTALSIAASNGHVSVVALLLGCNAQDNSDSSSLHMAARNGHAAVVNLLLGRAGADIDALDTHHITPLHYIVNAADDEDPPSLEDQLDCTLLLLQRGATITPQMTGPELLKLATDAVVHRRRDLVFTLLWRGVRVEAPEGGEAVEGASEVADKLAIETMLVEWPRGCLRAWRLEWHALFPSAFRADVGSLLLATLGSRLLDVGAEDSAGEAESMPRAARRTAHQPQNPLRTLHEHRLLEPVFQALLLAHMGGPARPPLANA